MKLIHVKIHGFRGILDQEFAFKDYTLLVGPNNAGKSSVIDAIRAFYEKDGFKFRKEYDFPLTQHVDDESWIELKFELTDQEHESLADDYKNPEKLLNVRKYFCTSKETQDGKPAAGLVFGYKGDRTLSKDPFYGAKNIQSGKFGDLIYIPAISQVDEHTKLTGPSALRDLLSGILNDLVGAGTAYGEFSASVQRFYESIRNEKTEEDHSLSGFEFELNDLLKSWKSEFRLRFTAPLATDIIKSMVDWELVDQSYGKAQSVGFFGSGFQRHFIYSLIQLGSRYIVKKSTKKAKDFSPSLKLVLFEEPEAFLHPSQQETLARQLMNVASTEHWQVVCTTHSAHFVSKNAADIPALIRLRRIKGEVEKYQIDPSKWEGIVHANQAINEIAKKYPKMAKRLHQDDMSPDMEAIKHFLWLNPDRSSLFFANHVLLVEGPTEVAFINWLVGNNKIAKSDCGLYVLDCMGKYNIHRFMNLLSHLGIPHSVIHDDDNDKDEHVDINRLITDARDPILTWCVKQLKGNLEMMLGLPTDGPKHSKPQRVLYNYENRNINEDNLKAFCLLVEECLPDTSSGDGIDSLDRN